MRISKTLLTALLLIFALLAAPLTAAAEEPTCAKTSDRVLRPFLDRLNAAEDGLAYHTEQTRLKAEKITKFIADLHATRPIFDEKRDKDQTGFADRVAAAEQAIADIASAHARRITELQGAITAAAAVENEREVDRIADVINRENARFSAGEKSIHASHLGFSNSTDGWRKYISDQTSQKTKNAADHAAGKIGLHLSLVGYTLAWEGVLSTIAKQQDRLAETKARKDGFHLPTLGYTLNGQGIDDVVAKRRAELADARARIAAGTFKLHVPTFGYTIDRNGVQAKMDEAKTQLATVRAGWGNGEYKTHNPAAGYTISKGDIDARIAAAEKDLADYIASGDDAKAHVPEIGYTTTGTDIKKKIQAATTTKDRSRWQAHYGHWQMARTGVVERKRAGIAKLENWLDVHRDRWIAEIKAREDKINGHFTRALAETPCGGAGSVAATAATQATAAVDGDLLPSRPEIVAFPETPAMNPEDDAAWETLKKRCTDLATYRKNGNGRTLKASISEYMAYLRVLEKRNPTHNVRQIIARLHADFYGYDLNQTVPVFEAPLFVHGAETQGLDSIDPVCRVKVGDKWKSFTPKFVYLPSGEEVDIAHMYAGPRSDMNRGDHNWISLDLLLLANTWAGDYYQVYFDSYTKFPHNQLRGDVLGIWMAQFYRIPRNRDVPLSQAMAILVRQLGTKPGAYGQLARPD